MHHHTIIINMFSPLLNADVGNAEHSQTRLSPSPREIVAYSKLCVEALIRLHYCELMQEIHAQAPYQANAWITTYSATWVLGLLVDIITIHVVYRRIGA